MKTLFVVLSLSLLCLSCEQSNQQGQKSRRGGHRSHKSDSCSPKGSCSEKNSNRSYK